jgi:hypothetical protein
MCKEEWERERGKLGKKRETSTGLSKKLTYKVYLKDAKKASVPGLLLLVGKNAERHGILLLGCHCFIPNSVLLLDSNMVTFYTILYRSDPTSKDARRGVYGNGVTAVLIKIELETFPHSLCKSLKRGQGRV